MAAQPGGSHNDDVPSTNDVASQSGHVASVLPSGRLSVSADVVSGVRTKVQVNRPVYTQLEFNEKYHFTAEARSKNVSQRLRDLLYKQCSPSGTCVKKSLLSVFPFIGIMSQYSLRRDLFSDIISGLTVGIMHIPQGQ